MAFSVNGDPDAGTPPPPPCAEPQADGFDVSLARARAGQAEDKGHVLQQCRDYLLAVAMRQLPSDLRAKVGPSDIVQETLARAFERFDRFTGEGQQELLAWLTRILDYRVLTAVRKFRHTEASNIAREARADGADDVPELLLGLAAATPGPALRAAAREEQLQVQAALERLRDDDRQIIELRNFELLSFVEIGRRTGRSAEAVRKHWGRAIERFSTLLDAE
ncbi:MAG: sigma-70 family RNA polymerase sigma factor [Pirellulales bacterium]